MEGAHRYGDPQAMTRRETLRASSFSPIQPEEVAHLEALGAELRRRREGQGLTRPMLARWVGYSAEHIRCLEEGSRRPRRSTLARLAHCLGADLPELVRLAGPALAAESLSSRKRAERPLPPELPPAPPRPKKPEPQPPPGCWWEGDQDPWDDPGSFAP